MIPRRLLCQKMLDHNLPLYLVNFIHHFFKANTCFIDGRNVRTHLGIMQGSVMAPSIFVYFTSELLDILTSNGYPTLAFADDIAIVAEGDLKLLKGIRLVE